MRFSQRYIVVEEGNDQSKPKMLVNGETFQATTLFDLKQRGIVK